MGFTVIWYGKQGIVEKTPFDAEKAAKDHALATFPAGKQDHGIVAVEVRKDDGTVVFSQSRRQLSHWAFAFRGCH